METHLVELTPEEYGRLNTAYPEGAGSGLIGRRAEEIVRIHMRRCHPTCEFQSPHSGADMKVVLSHGTPALLIEIKGTASAGVAWQQLKVSSEHSHRLLVEMGIPVYRVSRVFSQTPSIYVLKHGTDFLLAPEARWSFRPVTPVAAPRARVSPKRPTPEPVGSKYDPLREHLQGLVLDQVTLSFQQAADLLGFPLPGSAYKHRAFWANQGNTKNRPWARAWQAAGFEVEAVKQSATDGWVRFRRQAT